MKTIALFSGLIMLITSCNRPLCNNANSVFDTFSPEAKEYKQALASQLQSPGNKVVSYWFDKYEVKDNKDYIMVYVQGEDLCAKGLILVKDWKKLEGIRRTQGRGYEGAELKGLQLDITTDSAGTELILKDVTSIID